MCSIRNITAETLPQVGHLPSIDLVRLENGVATAMKIQDGFNDTEAGARAEGFLAMIAKFQHKVSAIVHASMMHTDALHSYRIWISLSTR